MGVTYDLIGTSRETKVFGFRGKYGCKADGCKANAKKCQSMKLLPAKGKNVLSCTTTPHRYWKGVAMASLTYKDLVKYLGVHLDPRGQVQIKLTDIEAEMVNLMKSDLRMFQKADAIRSNLIPRWLHKLRLSDLPVTKMRKGHF